MATQDPQRDDVTPSKTSRGRLHLREVRSDHVGYDGIGVELRAARTRAGVELADVAQKLRISQAYLEAIEEGRFDALPGHVYVFGFLKTYARFLELDEDIVVDRFRTETTGPQPEARLAFPSAMDRGRLPTGRLLLGGLLVAVLAYAGWFVFNSDERSTADRVAAIPERLATPAATADAATTQQPETTQQLETAQQPALLTPVSEQDSETPTAVTEAAPVIAAVASTEPEATIQTDTPRDVVTDVPVTAEQPQPIASAAAAAEAESEDAAITEARSGATVDPQPIATEETSVLPDTDETVVASVPPSPEPITAEIDQPVVTPQTAPPVTSVPAPEANSVEIRQLADASTAPIETEGASPAVSAQSEETAAEASTASTEAPVEVAARSQENAPPPLATSEENASTPVAGEYVPRVFGAGNESARIVLVADAESWVQVRATSGELLLTRVLRAGDRYLVPDRPGLVMMTGNVGAFKVLVDGNAVPKLGPMGVIGRNIPLDADRLRDGRISVDFDAE